MYKNSKEKRQFSIKSRKQMEYDQYERECPEELKKILREKPYAMCGGKLQERS